MTCSRATERAGRSPLNKPLGLAALVLAGLAALVIWRYSSVDVFANDAAQYVSVSDTYASTGRLATTTLYYELHHALGMPAVQTVWPPGFALLIGALKRLTGADSVDLIRAVNALAHLSSVIVLFFILRRIGPPAPALFLTGLYAFHAYSLYLAATGLSEPLYTLFLLAVALGLSRVFGDASPTSELPGNARAGGFTGLSANDPRVGWLLLAGGMAGLACLLRYQALVCAGVLALAVLIVSWRRGLGPLRSFGWAVLAAAPFVLVFGALVLRNLAIAHSITGGPQVPGAGQGLVSVLAQMARDVMQVVSGPLQPLSIAFRLLLLAGVGVLAWQSLRFLRRAGWSRGASGDTRLALLVYGVGLTVGTAVLVVLLAHKTTVYGVEFRYLVPTVPPLLIAAVALLAQGERLPRPGAARGDASIRWIGGAVAASLIALTAIHLFAWHATLQARHDVATLRHLLATRTPDGVSAATLLSRSAGAGAPVMSNQSQQLHLALRQPTLGVPERRLSARAWSDSDLHELAQRFDVHYIVLFKNRPLGGMNGRNDYVLPLARLHPGWTRSVVSTPDLELLEIAR